MLTWSEMRDRATKFARTWKDETRESAEYQSYWNDFFDIFGIQRRSVAVYQEQVRQLSGHPGFIDVFWPSKLIGEHKSAGKSFDDAYTQAVGYASLLPETIRPRYIILADYARMRLVDLEGESGAPESIEFPLEELPKHIRSFAFIPGYEVRKYKEQDPVNRKAVKLVVSLYQALAQTGYPREHLGHLLVRLVFCFFADDSGIFPPGDPFRSYLRKSTRDDGSDFGFHLEAVFSTLRTPESARQSTIAAFLDELPYVNGGLFADQLPAVFFTAKTREAVLAACDFNWSAVSPAIFGSMFQYVLDADAEGARHDFGAHYTSEKNILKVIDGLFMDELREELAKAGKSKAKLEVLWDRLAQISLLDPACGCGNFLVVAYRELRRLELEILKQLYGDKGLAQSVDAGQATLGLKNPREMSRLSVEQMYGIELLPFPAEIAKLSLWLTDHLANKELGDYFGAPFAKLPLTEQPHIVIGNALQISWESVVPKEHLTYILGNPPFIGSRVMDEKQRVDMQLVFGEIRELGFLDYVTAWYRKAAEYIQSSEITCAFVSTNSIAQGEQVGILWGELQNLGIHIHFAHRTFKWSNEAPGQAAVYCVIIGFGIGPAKSPQLFDYESVGGEPHEIPAAEINPYLVNAPQAVIIRNRQKPLSSVPEMSFGSMPRDGGGLILSREERDQLVASHPHALSLVRSYIGAQEFLNGEERFCLWLVGAEPATIRSIPEIMRRVEAVREFRSASKAASTRRMAETPTLFAQRTQPDSNYLLIPRVSSERRRYVPIGFFRSEDIAADSCLTVSSASLYHFGVLESEMHMAWMRAIAGRLKSDYRYSKDIVYNNFPWPDADEVHREEVEIAAQAVLSARAAHPNATLADLYDPTVMPSDLLKAHHALDRAVDRAYGITRPFDTEAERVAYLFIQYERLKSLDDSKKVQAGKRV